MSWAERAADRSPLVQRSRTRSIQQAQQIVDAARRLILEQGETFTTQTLVKEAGVAIQTFYRCFGGKDQLMLAVLEDLIAESAELYEKRARDLPDPLARLRSYLSAAIGSLVAGQAAAARVVTAEHWRLHQTHPEELAQATEPFRALVLREIEAAAAEGLLHPIDPPRDAWLVTKVVMSVHHHYAYVEASPGETDAVVDHLWSFCLTALGGHPDTPAPQGGAGAQKRSEL